MSAMNKIGIDSSQLTITPVQYNAFYPNGGYVDNEISVSTKDGRTVQLGLDLLQKNYDIGAWDVEHMLQAPVQT